MHAERHEPSLRPGIPRALDHGGRAERRPLDAEHQLIEFGSGCQLQWGEVRPENGRDRDLASSGLRLRLDHLPRLRVPGPSYMEDVGPEVEIRPAQPHKLA